MAATDGNGWVDCTCGRRHWGRHGAAGLVLVRPGLDADPAAGGGRGEVLLQLRAAWTHEGGTWGVPGGACDSHEDDVAAALREAHEETGVEPRHVRVVGRHRGVDHGVWRYTYVLALCERTLAADTLTPESDDVRWVALADVPGLLLHSGLAASWPALTEALADAVAP